MASIRTARVIAAVASIPLAAAMFTGVAQADNGSFADEFSNAANVGQFGGVGGNNSGNSSQSQQVAQGGGSNESNSANIQGWGNSVDQSDTTVSFGYLW
ncbi:hypothetical protein AB0M28_00810 [Streptomyces sp. NPDC051940]|uniref:hypothetical protein n=1 Tax=Streptomyces sp. NPDC051940 TaxID=3155675 RepID=UPI003444A426